ncbi:MAG TPA: hypothetical protein PLV70_01955 [Flavobacteriales bacterium]|nr:hypothetical protein [Flavobacteriales bacterium]HRQ83858.1 hypothetical protein [Flavobacteriales bacterium]
MFLIWVFYHGEVGIEAWEWLLSVVYIIFLSLYFSRQKKMRLVRQPEYKHFLYGLYAKIIGAMVFSLIYFYYYKGGDTISYFYSAVSMSQLATAEPLDFLRVLFGANDAEHLNLFGSGARPYEYVYYDDRTFMVIRIITPLVLFSFRSYVLTALLLSSLCYLGIWRSYQTFVGYFPSLKDKFAIAFLYMPSVIFWGSGIMKDTLTIGAACWWVHCFDQVFFKKNRVIGNAIGLVLAGMLLIMVKAYIFMILMPVMVLWLLYFRVARLKNLLLRLVVLPIMLLVLAGGSYVVLNNLGDSLGKFSLDEAMTTTMNIQRDMQRVEEYGSNYFDIGELDGTLRGGLVKAPAAINAALFRPYLWESSSVVVVISALENAWLLGFSLLVLWRTRAWFLFRVIRRNPLAMTCITFAIAYGFVIGISTPNFGALVRFKIVLVPFFVSFLYIVNYLNRERLWAESRGLRFVLSDYLKGEPVMPSHRAAAKRARKRGHGKLRR